jgi:hypothetical protein
MLLDHAGLCEKARQLTAAIEKTDADATVKVTGDRDGATYVQYPEALIANL